MAPFGLCCPTCRFAPHRNRKTRTEPTLTLTLHREPAEGWDESKLEAFYKQGFALEDTRDMKGLSTAFIESDMDDSWATLAEAGVQKVKSYDGKTAKALWAPLIDEDCCRPCGDPYADGRETKTDHILVLLEGDDKGCAIQYNRWRAGVQLPVFQSDGEINEEEMELKGSTPTAGKTYVIWLPGLKRAYGAPFIVRSVKKDGEATKINFDVEGVCGRGDRLVLRSDIEETCLEDFNAPDGMPRVCGADAVFVEVEASVDYSAHMPKSPKSIAWARLTPPAHFAPLNVTRLSASLAKEAASRVELIPDGRGRTTLRFNGRKKAEDLSHIHLLSKLAAEEETLVR